MGLSPRFYDELRSRLMLSDIIGRRVKVTRAGREYKACCPFHHEKTPSFTINDDKQFYHCFGCGAHGDVIKFVMEHDNLAFMDAIEMLAAEAGLEVPKQSPQQAQKAREEKDLYALMEDATVFLERNLRDPRNGEVLQYLHERGLKDETIAQFRIGFAPDDGQALRTYLRGLDYKDSDMIQVGVLKKSTKGGDPYCFFRDRVMFPVPDRRGRTVAFGGRVLPDHLRAPSRGDFVPPKYINSSETPLFHKGRMLYGEPIARRAAAQGQPLILVEGYLDVIACAQAGFEGALAPMGTAVTEDQIAVMWQMIPDFTKVPILCFDGDNAGRKAARRVCDRAMPLLEPGRSVAFAFMPDGEDPDSLIKSSGVRGFKDILTRNISLFDFLWASYTQGRVFDTPESKAGVRAQLEKEIDRIAHGDVQMHYKSQLNSKISDTFFPRREYKYGGGGFKPKAPSVRPQSPRKQNAGVFSKVLLAGLIHHPHIFDGVEEELSALPIHITRMELLRQKIVSLLSDDSSISGDDLKKLLENAGFLKEIDDICNESVYVHASFCSPRAKEEDIESKWLQYWNDGQNAALGREIRNGWKNASNEDDEEKLRALLSLNSSERAS